jgi:hypothetical protein
VRRSSFVENVDADCCKIKQSGIFQTLPSSDAKLLTAHDSIEYAKKDTYVEYA